MTSWRVYDICSPHEGYWGRTAGRREACRAVQGNGLRGDPPGTRDRWGAPESRGDRPGACWSRTWSAGVGHAAAPIGAAAGRARVRGGWRGAWRGTYGPADDVRRKRISKDFRSTDPPRQMAGEGRGGNQSRGGSLGPAAAVHTSRRRRSALAGPRAANA